MLHASGYTDAYMTESLDAFKSGQVAMAMNWFAFFPGLVKDENVGGDKIGFFVNPEGTTEALDAGRRGYLGLVASTDNMEGALNYIKWFAQPEVQKKWWSLGGYSCHNAVLNDPSFKDSQPFAADFLVAMNQVKDFWQEPSYAQLLQGMQKRLHDYVVADQGTAQEALRQADRRLDRSLPGRRQDVGLEASSIPSRAVLVWRGTETSQCKTCPAESLS